MAAAISAGDLALAMSRANASARLAGSDMDKFIGYVTTVADVTQKSAESVGESFKTIYSRFGNVKAGKFVASQEEMNSSTYNEEEFESLNDIETVLSSIGIKLRENAKEWRNIDDVLQDIAESWDNWDKTTQNAVATAVAGTRQRENVLQLFDNWDEVDKYAEIAANSYGTATEKMKAYTDSVEAAQQRIQVAIEDWALLINGAGYIKDFYNAIGFAIENIHHLIAVVSALAIVLNLNSIINTFTNGLTIMASKLTDIGMLFDKAKMNLSLKGTYTKNAFSGSVDTVREDFIFAQQQMFGQALAKYTSTLNAQDAQAVQNMQKEMLRMSSTDKLTVAQSLLTNTQLTEISDESAKHLANALLLVLNENERSVILQKIASGEKLSKTEHGLAALNNALKRVREKEYAQAVGNTMSKSGKMGEPRSMIATGLGMTLGGIAGGNAGGNLGEFLGGDSGKIYGTMLGSMVGSYGGKALSTVLGTAASTALKSGLMTGLKAGIAAIPGLGWVAIGATVAGLFFSRWKKKKEEALKEAEEDFKAAEEKYSAAKGSNVTAKQFDELAKGVDSLGRNISLTDEEYQSFLNKSNELAELFPELIVRTDEEGNKLVGLGNAVGGVAEKVAELNKQLQHEADIKLLDENIFGEDFNDTYKQIADLEDKIKGLKEGTSDTDLLKSAYDKYGVSYTTMSFQGGEIITSVEDEEKAFKARQNMVRDYENEIKNLKKTMSNYVIAEERELRYGEDASSKAFSKRIQSMTDDQKAIYQNAVSGINIEKKDSDGNYVKKSDQEIQDEILRVADLVDETFNKLGQENINIAFKKPSDYDTLEEMQKARQQLIDILMSIFGEDNVIDDTEAQIIIGLGFEVKDNTITDPQDILNNFRDMGVAEKIGIGNDPITIRKLSWLSPEDAQIAFELMNSGIVNKVTGSWQTLLNLIESDRGPIETVEGYASYYQELLAQEEGFQDEFNKVIDSRREGKVAEFSAGHILTEMTDEEIDESFSQYNSSIRGGIKNAKKNYEKNVKEYGKGVKEANELLQKELDGLFDTSKISALQGQLKLQLSEQFSGVDLGDDGLVSSFSELKDVLDSLADSFDKLKEAQKEYAATGKLSMETVLDLISTDENYLNVLNLSDDSIKLNSNAEEVLMNAKINTAKAALLEMRNSQLVRAQKIQEALVSDSLIEAEENEQDATVESIEKNTALTNNLIQQSNAALSAAYGLQAKTKAEKDGIVSAEDEAKANDYQAKAGITDSVSAPSINTENKPKKLDATTREQLLKEYESLTGISRGEAFVIGRDGQVLASKIDLNKDIYSYGGGFSFGGSIGALDKLYESNVWDDFSRRYAYDSKGTKTPLEKLQELESAINKEREAMKVFGTGKETAYYDKMNKNLFAQKTMLENLVANAESEEKRLEYAKQLEEVEVKIANLDDEEVEDKKKNLETMGATLAMQIAAQRELIKTSDTEEELIERQKELNDLLKQEQELRKNIRAYQRELIDTELEYESGTPDSKRYKELIKQKEALYKEDKIKAKLAIQDARNEAYLSFKNSQDMYDDFGNAKYTDDELWDLANNSEAVQEQVKNYIEAFQGASELAMQVVEDSINALDKKLDKLENEKPNEWTSISDIDDYYNDKIELLNDKIDIWEKALKDTSNLTDEQITSLVDSLNDATKAIQEAKIAKLEDAKAQDDKYYEAITWQVNQYVEELEKAKEVSDKWYDDTVKKLQDYNENLDRTNELLELQNKLKTASQEKERVYREGIGWVYQAPRQKIKEAQDELDKFYRQDQIDDLNNTKESEDKILDERIKNWQDYLTMLEKKYGEYEAIENKRILMERLNVETQEEIDDILKKDMDDFVVYTESKLKENLGNYDTFYRDFESKFDKFFENYKDRLEEMAELNREFLSLANPYKYLKNNEMDIEGGLATLATLSKADRETIFKKLDMSKNYAEEIDKAIKDGKFELAQEYALLREAKAEKLGKTLGQGNYQTNQAIWDEAMRKHGKTYSEEVNKELTKVKEEIKAGNAYSKTSVSQSASNINAVKENTVVTQSQTSKLASKLTEAQITLIKEAGYTVEAIEKLAEDLSMDIDAVIAAIGSGQKTNNVQQSTPSSSGGDGGGSNKYQTNRDYSSEIKKAIERGDWDTADTLNSQRNEKINTAKNDGVTIGGSGYTQKTYSSAKELAKANGWSYSSGLENGPVTYTGLAMLHGTQNAPEYVLNNDQAYNLLYNLSMSKNAKMAEFEPKNVSNETHYIVQGDIILEGVDNPAEFWKEVTTAMGNRWNVTKNR